MIRFLENYSLLPHNTFRINAKTRYFFEFTELADLESFVASNQSLNDFPLLVLGEGSNILFTEDFNGVVLHPNIPGISMVDEDRNYVWVEAGAGEVWDTFVQYSVNQHLGGVENLSLIPGRVGAAPVQNIGAYGQEAGDMIELVRGYDILNKKSRVYNRADCHFSYRDSIFKSQLKNNFVITSVLFKLEKYPKFNINYKDLSHQVKMLGEISLQNIRQAVINIRRSKLPDVNELGNAGSFFKNPIVSEEMAKEIIDGYPEAPAFHSATGEVKLSAGWLIEKAGWRGKRVGNVGMHKDQALVLVNYGEATGREILQFAEKISLSVYEKFGVTLVKEVNCI